MLRTLPKTKRQGKKKNPTPGQAMNESVASSWAYAVKAKPYGWRSASLDSAHKDAPWGTAAWPETPGFWGCSLTCACGAPVSREGYF